MHYIAIIVISRASLLYHCSAERDNTVIAVTVTLFLTIVLYTTVLLVGCAVWRQSQTK